MSKHKLIIIALIAITFAAINISVTNAQNIQDSEICYGYGSSDLQPKGIGNTVFPYTEKIGFWVQIQNPADVNYRIIWIDPDDSQYRNQAIEIIEKSGADWGIVFDSINIAETTAKNKLGVWDVELYIDGELARAGQFQIISYEEIQQQIAKVIEDKNELVDSLDDLRNDYDELQDEYDQLQTDYADLQEQVGTESDYEQLQDDYDDLLDDYEALKASQSSTRTMMYAAIVVALIAIVVAVYFGVLKK
jgi:hypothetical protein